MEDANKEDRVRQSEKDCQISATTQEDVASIHFHSREITACPVYRLGPHSRNTTYKSRTTDGSNRQCLCCVCSLFGCAWLWYTQLRTLHRRATNSSNLENCVSYAATVPFDGIAGISKVSVLHPSLPSSPAGAAFYRANRHRGPQVYFVSQNESRRHSDKTSRKCSERKITRKSKGERSWLG